MQVEALNITGTPLQQQPKAAENVDAGRKELAKGQVDDEKVGTETDGRVQPEEILKQIKSLSQDGMYSVRFEKNQDFDEMIVKVVDPETEEIIRQVPSEEVLGVKAKLEELSGKIVDTVL